MYPTGSYSAIAGAVHRQGSDPFPPASALLRSLFSLIADVEKIIKVISAYRRHCKYLPGFHIHRDSARSVLNVVILDGLIQRLFNIMLDREVNRCYKIKAIFGTGVALVLVKQKIGAVGIGKAHVFPDVPHRAESYCASTPSRP